MKTFPITLTSPFSHVPLKSPRREICTPPADRAPTALMAVCMGTYGVAWQVGNRRSLRKEQDRIAALRSSGHLKDEKSSSDGAGANIA